MHSKHSIDVFKNGSQLFRDISKQSYDWRLKDEDPVFAFKALPLTMEWNDFLLNLRNIKTDW